MQHWRDKADGNKKKAFQAPSPFKGEQKISQHEGKTKINWKRSRRKSLWKGTRKIPMGFLISKCTGSAKFWSSAKRMARGIITDFLRKPKRTGGWEWSRTQIVIMGGARTFCRNWCWRQVSTRLSYMKWYTWKGMPPWQEVEKIRIPDETTNCVTMGKNTIPPRCFSMKKSLSEKGKSMPQPKKREAGKPR